MRPFLRLAAFFVYNFAVLAAETALLRFQPLVLDPYPVSFLGCLASWMAASAFGTASAGHKAAPTRCLVPLSLLCLAVLLLLDFGFVSIWLAASSSLPKWAAAPFPRWGLAAALFAPPAFASGFVFPFFSESFETESPRRTTFFLAFAGCSAGALAAALVFLPLIGIRRTLFVAAGAVASAAGLFSLGRAAPPLPAAPRDPWPPCGTPPGPATRAAHGAAALAGGISFLLQWALFRIHMVLAAGTTFSGGIAVGAFFAGLALGALLPRPGPAGTAAGRLQVARGLCATAMAVAATSLAVPLMAERIVPALATQAQRPPGGPVLLAAAAAALLFLPSAAAAGTILPACLALATQNGRSGPFWRSVYLAYGLGALLAGLSGSMLVRWAETRGLLVGVSFACLLGAGAVFLWGRPRGAPRRDKALAAAALLTVAAAAASPWNPMLLTQNPAAKAARDRRARAAEAAAFPEEMIFRREGLFGVTSLHRRGPAFSLRWNGTGVSHSLYDAVTQRMLALLPYSFLPAQRALVIGLGSGQTLKDLLEAGARQAKCVEISQEIAEAATRYPWSRALANRVVIADAKRYLEEHEETFELIVSQPSHPWFPGSGSLFTEEFFRLASGRLSPGGLFCQWMQTYGADPADIRLFLRTFGSVFPSYTVWSFVPGDLVVVGSRAATAVPLADWAARLTQPPLRALLAEVGIDGPSKILAGYLFSSRSAALSPGPVSRYDLPVLEFSTAWKVGLDRAAEIHEKIAASCDPPPPTLFSARPKEWAAPARKTGQLLAVSSEWTRAKRWLSAAWRAAPGEAGTANDLAMICLAAGNQDEARRWIREAARISRSPDIQRNFRLIFGADLKRP